MHRIRVRWFILFLQLKAASFRWSPVPIRLERNEAPHLVLVDFGLAEIVEAIDDVRMVNSTKMNG